MAQTRKDLRGRVLRKGESQRRSDGRYVYTYTDTIGITSTGQIIDWRIQT